MSRGCTFKTGKWRGRPEGLGDSGDLSTFKCLWEGTVKEVEDTRKKRESQMPGGP